MVAFLGKVDVSAGDNVPGTLISQQQHFDRQEAGVNLAALHPRDAASVQAAKAGYPVAFAVQTDYTRSSAWTIFRMVTPSPSDGSGISFR